MNQRRIFGGTLVASLILTIATIGAEPPSRSRELFDLASIREEDPSDDIDSIAKLYKEAADLGYAEACTRVGVLYEEGRGVRQSYAEAYIYYVLASDAGSPSGTFRRSLCLYAGYGTPVNLPESFKWMLRSAELGYRPAMTVTGNMYVFGFGTERSIELGMRWLEKAAKMDDSLAAAQIGRIIESYWLRDVQLARDWYEISGLDGNIDALISLAETFLHSSSGPRIDPIGLEWLRLAISEGSAEAAQVLAYCLVHSSSNEGQTEKAEIRKALDSTNTSSGNRVLLELLEIEPSPAAAVKKYFSTPLSILFAESHNRRVAVEDSKSPTEIAKVIHSEKPKYPPALKLLGIEGKAVVSMIVDEEGKVVDAWAEKCTHPAFGESAVSAVRKWVFSTGTRDGRPAQKYYKVTLGFSLVGSKILPKENLEN